MGKGPRFAWVGRDWVPRSSPAPKQHGAPTIRSSSLPSGGQIHTVLFWLCILSNDLPHTHPASSELRQG